MFLYFDEDGVLKEIINDKQLRQNNSNWNKVYCYWEGQTSSTTSARIKYILPDNTEYQQSGTAWINYSAYANVEIPYSQDRDLRFFEALKEYKCFRFDIPDNVLASAGTLGICIQTYHNSAYVSMQRVAFTIELTATTGGTYEGNISPDIAVSVAEYNDLTRRIEDFVENYVTGATINDTGALVLNVVVNGATGTLTFTPITGTYSGDDWQTLTINGTTKNVGGGSAVSTYVKSVSTSGNNITFTLQDDSQIAYSPVCVYSFGGKSGTLTIDSDYFTWDGTELTLSSTLISTLTSLTTLANNNVSAVGLLNGGLAFTRTINGVSDTFTPHPVSGTHDGTNWETLTIEGTTKNIPTGGGSGSSLYKHSCRVQFTSDSSSSFTFTWIDNVSTSYTLTDLCYPEYSYYTNVTANLYLLGKCSPFHVESGHTGVLGFSCASATPYVYFLDNTGDVYSYSFSSATTVTDTVTSL